MQRLKEILFESDISLAAFLVGMSLLHCGLVAAFTAPEQFPPFNSSFLGSFWFWTINHLVVGVGFIATSLLRFPAMPSLCVGGYACLTWAWVASILGFLNFTSGITLNLLVIIMGVMMIQRSGLK